MGVGRHRLAFTLAAVATVLLGCAVESHSQAPAKKPPYVLRRVVRSLEQPVYVTVAPGEPGRLYVVLRRGVVRVVEGGRAQRAPFLDIHMRVLNYGEFGLLSIAFHPQYAANGLVYAAFNDDIEGAPVTVVEYRARDGRVDLTTERVLVRVAHPDSPYHNGGQLQFGPDGKLYVGVGDGGYTDGPGGLIPDPHGNGQRLDVLLGKLFRLDVDAASPEPELVAYGLRNPWRFSFAPDGDLVIGDVGWNTAEEIDVLPSGSGLLNFGWSVFEGRRRRPDSGELNPAGQLVGPTFTYPHVRGNCSVTGGYVYRGRAVPRLRGRYVFGDYCSGRIWSVRIADGRVSGHRVEPVRLLALVSFGEDAAGELYAVSMGGAVYRFAARRR